jgi:diguanylate cyclase (GGDEF)-like protein
VKRRNVLIIDDAKMIHALVRAYLEDEAPEIHSAYGGLQGLEAARTLLPDLILLDVEMPTPDGWDVCRQLKADPATRDIQIVFLTAETDTAQKIRGLEMGATDYVTKPFDPAELKARVRSALRTKELIDLLAEQAMIDGLTGLRNRRYFDDRLATTIASARRHGGALACVMIDVDHFKQFNDWYGQATGDVELRGVAEVLRANARIEDVLCRIGGEEFAFILPHATIAQACAMADHVRTALASATFGIHKHGDLKVTASFGVSDLITAGPDQLVAAADAALYEAKRAGRNRVHPGRQAINSAAA